LPPISVTAVEAALKVGTDEIPPFFRIKPRGNAGRIHQITE
jgi:hypothetical protein